MKLLEMLLVIFLGAGLAYATYFYWAVIITRKAKPSLQSASIKDIFQKESWKQ